MHRYLEEANFIVVEKPEGISTHSPAPSSIGFIEYVSSRINRKLYPAHRLDKDTSGILIFCFDKETTSQLSRKFEQHQVKKDYLLVTDRRVNRENLIYSNYIAKKDGKFIINSTDTPNSETSFEILREQGGFTLLRAYPKTGKPHQIRIHAEKLGFPILGDTEYKGTPFPRLMLHAENISFEFNGINYTFKSDPAAFFNELAILNNPDHIILESEYHKRAKLFNLAKSDSYRIIHKKEKLGFKCDYYAGRLWFYWYKDGVTENDIANINCLLKLTGSSEYHVSFMINKGASTELRTPLSNYSSTEWETHENNFSIKLKSQQGASPGFFIDQRNNRTWIKNNSSGKKVLNLFAYTCSLSLAAALGNAESITSIDTSKASFEWARQNFDLNKEAITVPGEKIRFLNIDARKYLENCIKHQEKFDLILCDPPSFARSKSGVFSLEKDFEQLVNACLDCLSTGGKLLFSTNFEKWSQRDLIERTEKIIAGMESRYQLNSEAPDLDCGMPMDRDILKTVIVSRHHA